MANLRAGMVFSTLFHAGIVYVAVVGLPELRREPPAPPEVVAIDFVVIDDVDRAVVKETPREEEKQPEQKVEEQKVAEAQPQPTAPSDASAVPLPEKVTPKVVKPKPKPKPKRRASPRITPRLKPKPPSELNKSRLAALIDRSKKKSAAETPKPKKEPEKKEAEVKKAPAMTAMEARRATATIKTALQQMVGKCWSFDAGASNAEDLKVRVRISFNVDGELARPPEIMDRSRMSTNPFYQAAAERAARAIRMCAPYELPKDKYEIWKQIDFIFDPSEMLGN